MKSRKPLEQDLQEEEEPPGTCPRPAKNWRVAVIANVKGETAISSDDPKDAGAEFDKKETIDAIRQAIESDGHETFFLQADSNLPFALMDYRPDICFNIAEGISGESREAQVPALLELLKIPYTASRIEANAISLDKTMTKRIWRDMHLPIADFQEFEDGEEILKKSLAFPLFVKPSREGTGMGMDDRSIVYNEVQLRQRVDWIINEYHQPALVEEYLPGREFTVAVMGRKNVLFHSRHPEWYQPDGFHRFPVSEVDNSVSITPGVYGHLAKSLGFDEVGVPGIICPAPINESLNLELQKLAIQGHLAIGATDISRIDFRMDRFGNPCLIEINTLPGLTPDFSDLCVISNAGGISYQDLILEILYLGAGRFGLLGSSIYLKSRRFEHHPIKVNMPIGEPI